MRWVTGLIAFAATLFACSVIHGARPALLELSVGDASFQGKVLARNDSYCWLLDRGGRIEPIKLKSVTSFRRVSSRFRSHAPNIIRSQLLKEFGKSFEVVGTRHYLVCAVRGRARQYAEIFESLYRTFHLHFSTRGFEIDEPQFPLVALVFPDRQNFTEYCERDGIKASKGLLGYYLMTSNRVALYDAAKEPLAANVPPSLGHQFKKGPGTIAGSAGHRPKVGRVLGTTVPAPSLNHVFATVQGNLKDTIIHEATHQVAFNTGLHSRIGAHPKWVIEGLATVFEAPGIRDGSRNRSAKNRINRSRYLWFQNFVKTRRRPKSLAEFVGSDAMFQTQVLDAYSEAWALTFYLIETRPRKYARLLKTIAERDPLTHYSSNQRIEDFKTVFGDNLDFLDADFLRFIERLK